MKKTSICTLAALAIVAFVLLQGCTRPTVDLTGKWAEVDGPDLVEFTSSGTFTGAFVYDADGFQKTIAGRYSASGEKITLTSSDDPKASMLWKVALANGILTVTYQRGGAAKLDNSTARFHKTN